MKDIPSSFIVVSYVHPVDLRARSVWICEAEGFTGTHAAAEVKQVRTFFRNSRVAFTSSARTL
jgi:hypothetical protein